MAYEPLSAFELAAATALLRFASLDSVSPLVAFDVIERTEVRKKTGKDQTERKVAFDLKGDRDLFTAINSAIRAAFFWDSADHQKSGGFVSLNVPLCVFSLPLWQVSIDSGVVADAEIVDRGYQVNAYPGHRRSMTTSNEIDHVELMSVVWSADAVSSMVKALDDLFAWACEELRQPEYSRLATNH